MRASPLIYLPVLFLGFISSAVAQSEARPAMLGQGSTSLINVLDGQRIMKHGQKDAVVSFTMGINAWGLPSGMLTYNGTPDSKVLSQELLDQFERAKFIPARYGGHPAGAVVNGTLVFAITRGTPHLRLFLNQDNEHLKKGDDFVAPQWIFPINVNTEWFDKDRYYREHGGMVSVRIDVNAHGKLESSNVLRVYPPERPFGPEVAKHIGEKIFRRLTSMATRPPAPSCG